MRNEHPNTPTWTDRGPVRAIVNSVAAARLRDERWIDQLEHDLGAGILRTEGPGDAPELTRTAVDEGCRTLLVAGGDGSVNEVVNALGDDARHVLLGIIPIGTGNDLATALGMPAKPEQAVEALQRAHTTWLDTVQTTWTSGSRLAVNACTAGFSALVDDNLDPRRKELLGGLAYMLSAGATLPELESHRLQLRADDEELAHAVYNVVVANGPTIGGGVRVAPAARLDDGWLELLVVPALPLTQLALVVPKIAMGDHLDDQRLITRRVRTVELDADPAMRVTVDGEVVGSTPASLEVRPRSIQVLAMESPSPA